MTTDLDEAGAPSAGAPPPRRIPRGTRSQPAKPVNAVVRVENLSDLTLEWTNDEKVMELGTYFDPATSNLSMSYNIHGLQPVIRKGTKFLLKDANNNYYQWDCETPGLWLITNARTLDAALDEIIYHPVLMETERMGHNLEGNRRG
ncbi:hypothetical protein NW757_010666 [Fusarium falciforme]|nr:hypothetical protein NW757_010666 [Fusarium falciforme]